MSILVVTDGPAGASARFTQPNGDPGRSECRRSLATRPPRDTNRAGEAFAATLLESLLAAGWDPSTTVVDEGLMRKSMLRASAAAALVLDRVAFGFPGHLEIDAVLRSGKVE